ncbi:MAG: nicotinate-nucleotide adenylyltransferase [Lachnospiraceae bacterium]|nr:nicotinate-nucleotide adenylyltransferase [Lachnospiraceae bacterium]
MRRIGILGGTFDPIHNGHLMMANAARQEAGLDEIWYIPTGTPAYKQGMQAVTEKEHRGRMTELAAAADPWGRFSRIELDREGNTYTAVTLKLLTQKYPNDQFYYIVGADSLDYMERWYCPQEIFSHAKILAVMRETQSRAQSEQKIHELSEMFGARIRLLSHPQVDVSSTMIRQMVRKGMDITSYVPKAVADYIRENGLYQDAGLENAKESREQSL